MAQPQLRVIFYTDLVPKVTHIYANNSAFEHVTQDPRNLEQVNIPLFSDEIGYSEFLMLSDAEKEATYKKWPESKGKLRMLFEGVVFKID